MEENLTEEISEPVTKKDPKKVEQGKRLAAISRQAKEEKMREKINEENFSYFPYIVYSVAILSSAGFVYLLLFRKKEEPQPVTIIREPPSPQKNPPPKKFEGFD